MNNRNYGFLALLAVIGVSIVFGMVIGGQLNAPPVVMAAPAASPLRLAPASTVSAGMDFADVVEQAMPAVVSVEATQVTKRSDPRSGGLLDDPFRFFFGRPPEGGEEDGPQGEGDLRQFDPRQRPEPSIGEGSGFLISSDGYILTNSHVVEGADMVRVATQSGREYEAAVIGTDTSIDLALLKIDPRGEELPSLPLGDSRRLRVGQWVIAIGNPLEYAHTVTVGVVSAKERRVPIGSTDRGVVSFIQTDAAINFGNSGGPLLDAAGNVIGINTAIRRANYAEGIGFALPINQARNAMEQLRDKGYVSRGFIGITMNNRAIDEEAREFYGLPDTRGVIIQEVTEGGPAYRAGMRPEDIIREVDGEMVLDNMDLISKIASRQPGESVRLQVFRKGQMLDLTAKLVDRAQELEARNNVSAPGRREQQPEKREATGLGVTVENISSEMFDRLGLREDQRGVLVTDVEYDSEAADKGIVRNMIIVSVNDRPTSNVSEWEAALEDLAPGTPVKINALAGNQGTYFFLRVPPERDN